LNPPSLRGELGALPRGPPPRFETTLGSLSSEGGRAWIIWEGIWIGSMYRSLRALFYMIIVDKLVSFGYEEKGRGGRKKVHTQSTTSNYPSS
jgi:hypothetical protein